MKQGPGLTLLGGVLAACVLPATAAETGIPAQCYAAPVTEGIPVTYARESIVDQPVLIKSAEPEYPAEESDARPFYCAAFSYSVGPDGVPVKIETLYDSHAGIEGITFGADARATLQSWRYQPGLVDKGGVEFLGFTAVFFKGFGEAAIRHQELAAAGASIIPANDIANDWQSYGKTVTQEELEQLERAADQKIAPGKIAAREAGKPKKKKPKIPNSWIVADDGSVLIGDKVYAPGDEYEAEQVLPVPAPEPEPQPVVWTAAEPAVKVVPPAVPAVEPEAQDETDPAFPPLVEQD